MVTMRFPWKRCDWYLVFAGIASPALPPTVERCLRNHQTTFQSSDSLCGASRNELSSNVSAAVAVLTRRRPASYSSLRRKKSTRQAGEMRHNARRFSALLVRAEPSTFEWLLETRFNRACVFACVLTWLLFKSNSTSQKREEKA